MPQPSSPGTGRRQGVVKVADIEALKALYAGSLGRRHLFLKTSEHLPLNTTFDLHIVLARGDDEVRLSAAVRFLGDAKSPRGNGLGVEVLDARETVGSKVRRVVGQLPQVEEAGGDASARAPLEVTFDPKREPGAVDRIALIAEYDAELQRLYARMLEAAGFRILLCKDGLHALELFEKNRVTLLVVDYLLPHLDGAALVEKVLKKRKVPVIFASTVLKDQNVAARMRAVGVQWVIEKPLRLETLRRTFDEAIAAAQMAEAP